MILGVDPGARRVGIAVGDLETRVARPLEVIDAHARDPVGRIVELSASLGATRIVVGRPVGLSGKAGPAVDAHASFVAALRRALDVPVDELDERLTTVAAERRLRSAGLSAARRKAVRDAVAAQVLLQDYLDGIASADPRSLREGG
jgi:putative Holliday junction resolvase